MSPDSDYYGYAPLVRLDRTVCLVGLPGADAGLIASWVTSLWGLQLGWLDRIVEHRAGLAIDGIVMGHGEAARLDVEQSLLPELLRRDPPPIIVLSEVTLTAPDLADRVRAESTVIVIRRPHAVLLDRIHQARARRPLHYARLGDPVDIQAIVARLEPDMLHAADHVVDLGADDPQTGGRRVAEILGLRLPGPG